VSILRRVREILKEGTRLDGPVSLMYFLSREFSGTDLQNQKVLDMFLRLDDTDVMSAIKLWQYSQDKILSLLCRMLMERNLPKLVLHKNYPSDLSFERDLDMIQKRCNVIGVGDFSYFIERGVVENKGYDQSQGEIMIMSKEGELSDIYDISDMLSARAFSQITKKYFLCTANL
jgi:hypothetical protein